MSYLTYPNSNDIYIKEQVDICHMKIQKDVVTKWQNI